MISAGSSKTSILKESTAIKFSHPGNHQLTDATGIAAK